MIAPIRVVAQSGSCGVLRDVADEAPILLFAAYNVVIGFVELESPGDAHGFVDFSGRGAFRSCWCLENSLSDCNGTCCFSWVQVVCSARANPVDVLRYRDLSPRPPFLRGKGEKGGEGGGCRMRRTLSPPRFGEGPGEGSFPRLFRKPAPPFHPAAKTGETRRVSGCVRATIFILMGAPKGA